jgi:hypothetical protein
MLIERELADIIITATRNKGYPDIWYDIALAINNYITENAVIRASYTGMLGNVVSPVSAPPLPLHEFRAVPSLSGAELMFAASNGGMPGLLISLSAQLSNTRVGINIPQMLTIPLSVSPVFVTTITGTMIVPGDSHEQSMMKISQAILSGLRLAIPTPAIISTPTPAIASDGSAGVITLLGIT